MAADGCVFHRILSRSRSSSGSGSGPSQAAVLCREQLLVLQLRRYVRDQGSTVYFPQSVLSGDDLYDVTLTDGDCRLRVTLDPGLNQQVERRVLRAGSTLGQASFSPTFSDQVPGCPREVSYRLVNMVVRDEEEDGEDAGFGRLDLDSLPWFGSSELAGPEVPLRASRSVFLPLWNNVDYSGDAWREAPPPEESDEEEEGLRPAVSVSKLRDCFLSGRRGRARGQLIVRIMNKSQLMYFGRADENCECPYKAVLEVCDRTGSTCVVLWNSMCVSWYRCLKPGDIISLRQYRVKQRYLGEAGDIEISVNSRNPAAHLSLLSESRVSPEYTPPEPSYTFCHSQELLDRPHGTTCDVIGLLMFAGRSERVRSRDGKGAELLEYRWLQLEDDSGTQPITVKLFSTSQPEAHRRLHPLSVVVCTRLRLIRSDQSSFYLTNTTFTQVYCTGLDQHSQMSYRKLPRVQLFLQWLRSQDDGQVLSRALIGGFFIHPPLPVSLETFMKERKGELSFLRGAELQRELQSLCFRERRSFFVQATVTMVTYSLRGAEDRCMFWMERSSSSSSSPQLPLSSSPLLYLSPTPPSVRRSPSSPSSSARSSVVGLSTPHRNGGSRKWSKRKLMLAETPKKRLPWATPEPEHNTTVILFQASMEFLENPEEEEEQQEEDVSSFTTAPLPPAFQPVAMETLPMRFDHAHREEQAAVVTMEGGATARMFNSAPEDYYTLKLRVLSDGLQVDAVFLPHSSSSSVSSLRGHSNTWTSILSHGAFSSHGPPPSPADLIATADKLTNQRLVCVLEACHLGGARTELVLTRAFHLTD
ncbi:RPA-related protein RADX isoform X3 [Oryzias latipes]|uniref:RPA-related protein RADX isoform X3 n=1 Tax=Oryzias latipes TaxID=8090 RepID=UPI000CE1A947|nr:RPA-related protein RADX isoform X3 [Oryzias latipes]